MSKKDTERRQRSPVPPAAHPGYLAASDVPEEARIQARKRRGCRPILAALVVLVATVAVLVVALALPGLSVSQDNGRLNFLLVGIDRRSGSSWAYRTDTIMVVTVDPATRSLGVLSIPRDLQLSIPGYGEDRINTANVYGYQMQYPGGGPALLQATIQANFGVLTTGYLMVDFETFVRIVDALGGIDIDVTKALHDTRYPDPRPGDPYAFKTIHFDAGLQHMDGTRALEYARSRMSTSDFDRARRQQEVLLAFWARALRLPAVPRWPALAAAVLDGIKTDMDVVQLLRLAFVVLRSDQSSLQQVVLEPPLVVGHRRADGASVQLPKWDLIAPLLDGLFGR